MDKQENSGSGNETPTAMGVVNQETGLASVIKFLERIASGHDEPDEIDEMLFVLRKASLVQYAAQEALVALATLKITDQEKPYAEISNTLRNQIAKSHDLLKNALSGSGILAPQTPVDSRREPDEQIHMSKLKRKPAIPALSTNAERERHNKNCQCPKCSVAEEYR